MRERLRVVVHGAVQGVGFRPFVYRLATDLGLDGWVRNVPQGVLIEVEGRRADLEAFRARLDVRARLLGRSSRASNRRGSTAPAPAASRFWRARPADRSRPSSCPTSRRARSAGEEIFRSRESTVSLSVHQLHELRTAIQHHRGAALRPCRHVDEALSRCVPSARPNTTIRSTGASTRSRTPARPAARGWRCGTAQGHVTRHARRGAQRRDGGASAGQIVAVKGLGGFHLMVDARQTTTPSGGCARASTAKRSRSR